MHFFPPFQPVDDEVTEFFEDAEEFYSTYLAQKSSGIFLCIVNGWCGDGSYHFNFVYILSQCRVEHFYS